MRQQSPLRSRYRAAHHYCLLFVALIVTLLGAAPAFSLPGDFAQPPGSMSFLPAHLAFKPTATALSSEQVEIHFDIQPGYYLYRSKLAVEATGLVPADVRVNAGELPPGVQKDDPNFGPTEIYTEPLTWPVSISGGQRPLSLTLSVRYQGCASQGICYPPEVVLLPVTLPVPDSVPTVTPATAAANEA